MGLTIKQEKFAQGLFAGLSQREAYKQAFNATKMLDKTIDEKACIMANTDKIRARCKELTDELKERNMVTVEKVLKELSSVGFANGSDFAKIVEKSYMKPIYNDEKEVIGQEEVFYKTVEMALTDDIDKSKLPAIAGIKSTKDGIEVKMNDKVKALELMGKHLGMFIDKVESTNLNLNKDITDLSDEELEAELKSLK